MSSMSESLYVLHASRFAFTITLGGFFGQGVELLGDFLGINLSTRGVKIAISLVYWSEGSKVVNSASQSILFKHLANKSYLPLDQRRP